MKKLYEEADIQGIADAIRSKNGTTNTYKTSQMKSAIEDIPSGSGRILHPKSITFSQADVVDGVLDLVTGLDLSQCYPEEYMFGSGTVTDIDLLDINPLLAGKTEDDYLALDRLFASNDGITTISFCNEPVPVYSIKEMCKDCTGLRNIRNANFNWSTGISNAYGAFNGCVIGLVSLTNCTFSTSCDCTSMFAGNTSLFSVTMNKGVAGGTNAKTASMFQGCSSLGYVNIKALDLSTTSATNMLSMFNEVPDTCRIEVRNTATMNKIKQAYPNLTNIAVAS